MTMLKQRRRQMSRLGTAAIATTIAATLGACMSLSQPYPSTAHFGLAMSDRPAADTGTPSRQGALRIGRFHVTPPSSGRQFVYRMDETTFTGDYHNAFVAAPDRLFAAALLDGLIANGPFATIVEPGGTADAALRLETTVNEIHGDFRDASAPMAVIRARFVLLEDAPATTRQLGEWSLERREPIASPAAADLAAGYSRAWSSIVDELSRGLRPYARP